MAYCTLDDIRDMIDEDEIIRYTDDNGAGRVNTDVTDKAVAGADALINSHIAQRYAVPVSPVPDMLCDIAVDIAIYKICSRRSQAPDEIRTKYDDAVKFLEKVAAGKTVIPEASSAPASSSEDAVTITSKDRIFTSTTLKGF